MKNKRKVELNDNWKKVATEAITNEEFKNKLVEDPVAIMGEYGLVLPEGITPKYGTGHVLRLTHDPDIPDDIKEEVLWWKWRLDMIREFGREEADRGVKIVAPETEDGV
ncbi:MAG: hypothetical protein ACQ9MH_02060 [Nitrospinales bacterium]